MEDYEGKDLVTEQPISTFGPEVRPTHGVLLSGPALEELRARLLAEWEGMSYPIEQADVVVLEYPTNGHSKPDLAVCALWKKTVFSPQPSTVIFSRGMVFFSKGGTAIGTTSVTRSEGTEEVTFERALEEARHATYRLRN